MMRSDATRGRVLPLAVADFLYAAAFALISLTGDISFAATRSWDGGGGADTDWTTGANWDVFNTVPAVGDTAQFDRGAAFNYTVTFPLLLPAGDITTDRLIVGSNTVTFEPDHSNTDYIAGTSATDELGRGIIIGEETNDTAAALTSHLGLLSTAAATLGHVAGSSGTLTLNQNNDQFSVTSNSDLALIIGRGGTGVLNVSGGADVNITGGLNMGLLGASGTLNVASGATVDSSTSHIRNGTATVTGTNSSWNSGPLDLGAGGFGTLNVSDGGSVTASGAFHVGTPGTGSVSVTSGGILSTTNAQIGSGNSIGSGVVTIAGVGSTWNNGNSGGLPLVIGGSNGPGTISVSDGGRFTNAIPGVVHILQGSASVDGAGSSWNVFYTLVSARMTVSNGGTVYGTVSVVGTLKGNGNIAGYVDSQGVVAPGDSLGALHIINIGAPNDYVQQASGSLQIELGGTTPGSEYDQLLVAGNIKLNGTLEVSLVSSFSPAFGNSFNILDWDGTLTGQYANVNLPTIGGSLGWDTSQLYTTGVLSVILLGDYNKNGTVDAADYVVWRKTDGSPAGYNLWRANFGRTAGSGAGASMNIAVPEPTTLLLFLTGMLAMYSRNRVTVS
jgi:T5SS/PEP-CTERM-associated repeat protein